MYARVNVNTNVRTVSEAFQKKILWEIFSVDISIMILPQSLSTLILRLCPNSGGNFITVQFRHDKAISL